MICEAEQSRGHAGQGERQLSRMIVTLPVGVKSMTRWNDEDEREGGIRIRAA